MSTAADDARHAARGSGRRPLSRAGFSLTDAIMIVSALALFLSITMPTIDLTRYRMDLAARRLEATLRRAATVARDRGVPVVVSFDLRRASVRVLRDGNGNGLADKEELRQWHSLGDGALFAAPPHGVSGSPAPGGAVVVDRRSVDGMPSVTFDPVRGVSAELEVYITSRRAEPAHFRAILLDRDWRSGPETARFRFQNGGWSAWR